MKFNIASDPWVTAYAKWIGYVRLRDINIHIYQDVYSIAIRQSGKWAQETLYLDIACGDIINNCSKYLASGYRDFISEYRYTASIEISANQLKNIIQKALPEAEIIWKNEI